MNGHPTSWRRILPLLAVGALLFLLPEAAAAQPEADYDAIDLIFATFVIQSGFWITAIGPYVLRLFVVLAGLELLWTAYEVLFRRHLGTSDAIYVFARRLLVLLILFGILQWSIPGQASDEGVFFVANELRDLGSEVALTDELHPVDVLNSMLVLNKAYAQKMNLYMLQLSITGPLAGLLPVFATLSILLLYLAPIIFLVVYLYVWVEQIILVSGGVLMLGFMGSRITIPWAETYPTILLRNALRFLLLYLFMDITTQVLLVLTEHVSTLGTVAWPSNIFEFFVIVPIAIFGYVLILAAVLKAVPAALLSPLNSLSLRPLFE